MKKTIADKADLKNYIIELINNFNKKVIYLNGDLGVGKTTFVQTWLGLEGVVDQINSPSYGLMNIYHNQSGKKFLHADLYRIFDGEELLYLDVESWLDWADLLFIEWPANGVGYLPKADLEITLFFEQNQRYIQSKIC